MPLHDFNVSLLPQGHHLNHRPTPDESSMMYCIIMYLALTYYTICRKRPLFGAGFSFIACCNKANILFLSHLKTLSHLRRVKSCGGCRYLCFIHSMFSHTHSSRCMCANGKEFHEHAFLLGIPGMTVVCLKSLGLSYVFDLVVINSSCHIKY